MAVSNDGTLLVTISHDQSVKVFDVLNFDMMLMLQRPFVPSCAEWVYRVRPRPYLCGIFISITHTNPFSLNLK